MRHLFDAIPEGGKHAMDWLAALTVLGTLARILPSLAAILTIVWTSLRIYDRLKHGPSGKSD